MKIEENSIKPRRYRPNMRKKQARTNSWTKQRRTAQREHIHKTRPWRYSTGPRSDAGKAKIKNNALKHGFYGRAWKSIKTSMTAYERIMCLTRGKIVCTASRKTVDG